MKLPSLPFLEKKEKPAYYLSLILRDDKATAIVFKEFLGTLNLIGQGEAKFENSIEEVTMEELLGACDKVISKAEESLPENIQTQKAIFSLKDSWVEDNKIKKEYLDKLRKVSDELGLTPIGFLQTSEAIINLLQEEEGAPITAIFAQIGKHNLTVSLLKASRITENKSSVIHESAPFTVDTLLKHFEMPEILPNRVIIFSSQENDLSQEFIAHHWSKSLPFLHLPQIQVVPDDFDIRSVMFGAAKQMGFEVMAEFKKETLEEVKEMEGDDFKGHVLADAETAQPLEDSGEETKEEAGEAEQEKIEEVENMASFGFMQEDVAKIKPEKQEIHEEIDTTEKMEPVTKEEFALEQVEESFSPGRRKSSPLAGISAAFASMLAKINIGGLFSKGMPGFKGKKVIIPTALILILIILGVYFAFTKKATVNLILTPKTQEQSEAVTFSLSGSTDPENKLIAVESTTDSQDGSVTISATGKKETGEPAKGNITFYSRFTESKTIASGTVISANNLDFTTDKEVKIASASADASASPATASVAVTAKKIGKESNLPSGTKFNVASLSTSDIIAKNDNAFSGGSKKDITIVSKQDYQKLEDKLIKDLEQKAKDSISKKGTSDKNVLPVFIDATIEDKDFSKKVDDEASQVALKGTVSYTGLLYVKKDLTDFTKSLIASSAKDLNIDEKNLKIEVANAKKKNDKQITADLKITAKLLPKINQSDLTNKIKGLPVKEAEAELRQINQVADVKISISPPLPFISNNLPTSPAQITFKVSSDE